MKERPILFNTAMVQAILAGRKTQTRRLVPEWQLPHKTHDGTRFISVAQRDPRWGFGLFGETAETCMDNYNKEYRSLCPFGRIGQRLWVRETFQGPLIDQGGDYPDGYEKPEFCVYAADGVPRPEFTTVDDETVCRWRPSIHMPRWACRIILEITNVRVERLQDITESDAVAEGCQPIELDREDDCGNGWTEYWYAGGFRKLWESINSPESWSSNPWVWVVDFKVLTTNGKVPEVAA
ncbi:MAG: hypothetical protein CVV11_20020 [Gammaproteobacteria bacterium HGW-Gammaproteobacteria-15]|nr:MAG: hypothetical protein CVV11_20020 [Gammaproteobacteria bacterium HGW-Gammaproteobacteria-15]